MKLLSQNKRLFTILVAVVALIFLILMLYKFLFLKHHYYDLSNKYPNALDKSCKTDSDCVIESAALCGYVCVPNEADVYNKETAVKIQKWRGDLTGITQICPVVDCMALPINYIPKCVNDKCTIKRTISCKDRFGNICGITDSYTISLIEKESGFSISEAKRSCNCT